MVVTYQADLIDPDHHLGWSVIVHGYAHAVIDPDTVVHYQGLPHPWVQGEMDHVIRIVPKS